MNKTLNRSEANRQDATRLDVNPEDAHRQAAPFALPTSPVAASSAATPADHDALPAGTRFGEFEILRVLGVGGFGIVYLVHDHSLGRQVALKEYMPASLAVRGAGPLLTVRSDSQTETYAMGLRSFVNEARLLARFDHPSLVKVYRFWEDNATAYMVMPYLNGTTLRDARRSMTRAPGEAWIRSVLEPMLDALDQLHREGVYHRDIAPDNILIPDEGAPILLDFGAARHVITDRTQSITAILKPSYAPIEQYADITTMRQGPWTDIYALGAVMHYLLFGVPPAPATARAVQADVAPITDRTLPNVSADFIRVVAWMLGVKPDERPQSVAALRAALAGLPPIPAAAPMPVTLPNQGQAHERTTVAGFAAVHPGSAASMAAEADSDDALYQPTVLMPTELQTLAYARPEATLALPRAPGVVAEAPTMAITEARALAIEAASATAAADPPDAARVSVPEDPVPPRPNATNIKRVATEAAPKASTESAMKAARSFTTKAATSLGLGLGSDQSPRRQRWMLAGAIASVVVAAGVLWQFIALVSAPRPPLPGFPTTATAAAVSTATPATSATSITAAAIAASSAMTDANPSALADAAEATAAMAAATAATANAANAASATAEAPVASASGATFALPHGPASTAPAARARPKTLSFRYTGPSSASIDGPAPHPASARPAPEVVKPVTLKVARAPATAREACGDRSFFSMALCLNTQCEYPRFREGPECVRFLEAKRKREEH